MFNNFRLKRVTYNLGTPVETELDITCAVDNKKLNERLNKHENHLLLKSKNDPKEITYVISDMVFPPHFKLTTDDNVIFMNCLFNGEVFIERANKVSFTNNRYNIPNNNFIHSDRFFVVKKAKSVNFINENFVNRAKLSYLYDLKINAENVSLENTNIYDNYEGHININCRNLEIKKDSYVNLKTGYIRAKKLVIDDTSDIYAKSRVMVETENAMGLSRINCEDIIINGARVKGIDRVKVPTKPRVKVKTKRNK